MTFRAQPVKSLHKTRLRSPLPGVDAYERSLRQLDNNDEQAFRLNAIAAEEGMHDAVLAMGWLYLDGVGVKADFEKATYWYKKAARSGDLSAFFSLGHIAYLQKAFDEARIWFSRAAEKGHTRSRYLLGRMYWRGEGVERDRKHARRLIAEAAKANVAEAQRAERYLTYLGLKNAHHAKQEG